MSNANDNLVVDRQAEFQSTKDSILRALENARLDNIARHIIELWETNDKALRIESASNLTLSEVLESFDHDEFIHRDDFDDEAHDRGYLTEDEVEELFVHRDDVEDYARDALGMIPEYDLDELRDEAISEALDTVRHCIKEVNQRWEEFGNGDFSRFDTYIDESESKVRRKKIGGQWYVTMTDQAFADMASEFHSIMAEYE